MAGLPPVSREQAVLESYFLSLGKLSFDKAKDIAVSHLTFLIRSRVVHIILKDIHVAKNSLDISKSNVDFPSCSYYYNCPHVRGQSGVTWDFFPGNSTPTHHLVTLITLNRTPS